MRSVEMKKYENIVQKLINNMIGNSTCSTNIFVEVEPEIRTCLLDPDTKRLTKIDSIKIQENEIRIWNVATNLALYKPNGDNSLYWSLLLYRSNIVASPVLKGSVKMTDQ